MTEISDIAGVGPIFQLFWDVIPLPILPEEMSKERFEWLNKIAGIVITTPGCESNRILLACFSNNEVIALEGQRYKKNIFNKHCSYHGVLVPLKMFFDNKHRIYIYAAKG